MRINPVTAALGAVIEGVDLNVPLGDATRSELRKALRAHLVLFFPEQHIDDESQLALAACFGEPEVHPIRGALGDDSKLHDIVDGPESAPDRDGWHTDVTYMERPPSSAVLRCEVTPEYGGDTVWANMYLAYEKLSEPMKTYLGGLRGFHATDAAFLSYIQNHLPEDACGKVMDAVGVGTSHPIVRTHPETRPKALRVNSVFTQRIRGVTGKESRAVLGYLYDHIATPEYTCRFHWETHSVAFWDNRCTQHYAIADYGGAHRLMHQVTVNGDKPV